MSLGKKISELPVATTLTGLELAVVVQTSTTKQSTPEAITASVSSRLDNVVSVNNAALTSINNVVSALEIRVSAVSALTSVNAAAITSINAEVSLKVYRTGDYMTNARYIEFDTSASNGLTTGKLAWNSNDGTLDIGLLGTTVLQIGQETLFYVKNTDTTTIADGRLVMATGVVGNSGKIEAQRANGSGAISAEYFLGIATQDIPVGEFGYVTHFGLVRGINATGSQYGQTWAEADLLYANTSIAGGLTNVPPPYPGFSTPLAIVVNPVSNAGSIFVRMKSGEYLEQLHDVDISAKASGDIIVWSSTLGAWTNSQAFVSAQADVSALEIRVSAVSAVASANSAAITSVNNVVSALEVRVSNASATNTTQTAAITSINNVVSALEIRVSAASAQAASNVAAITSVNNVVSALEIRVSAVSAQAATNTAAITSINSVVSALEIRVSSVSAAVVSINNVVSALGSAVAAVGVTAVNAALTSINAVVSLKVNRSGDTMTGPLIVNVSSASDALRITQTGAGNAFVVEDSANPDATPFVIDASGNVGIGTSSPNPAFRLDVSGIGRFTGGAVINGGNALQLIESSGNNSWYFNNNANNLTFTYNASERMRITSTGNVGIGSTANDYGRSWRLVARQDQNATTQFGVINGTVGNSCVAQITKVTGTSNSFLDWGLEDGNGSPLDTFAYGSAVLAARWNFNSSERMRITSAGNVGIGTSSPQNRLQVNGSFGRGAPVTKTGNFTLADTENWIICNGTGSITVTFPAAASWTGREVMIKTIAAQTVVSASSDVVPLAGGAAGTAILSATAGAWATLVSDGTNWIIMQA